MRFQTIVFSICGAVLLTACSTMTGDVPQAEIPRQVVVEDALQLKDDGKVADAAQVMMQISERSVGMERLQYLFDAAQYYLQVPDLRRAADALQKIQVSASGTLYETILHAQISLRTSLAPTTVPAPLVSAQLTGATPALTGVYWLTMAEAWEAIPEIKDDNGPGIKKKNANKREKTSSNDSRVLNALQARLKAEEFLTAPETLLWNQEAMWKLLSAQPVSALKTLRAKSRDSSVNAWMDLAILAKEFHNAVPEKKLASWGKKYPEQIVLNQRLMDLRGTHTSKRRHVALILPTKAADLGAAAKAVWEGFQAAQKSMEFPYPVKLYETGAEPATALGAYRAAVENGAVLIVGPLPRNSLSVLAKKRVLAVPTIALNVVDDKKLPVNLYQFGLPIAQEARIVARAAKDKGYTEAIVLRGGSSLDQRSSEAFIKEWLLLSNTVKSELPVQDVPGALRIAADSDAKNTMIFFASEFQNALPAMKLLPPDFSIFGTSALNTVSPEVGRLDKSRNIYFVDTPTLVQSAAASGSMTMATKDNGVHARLYSLGLDVCSLSAMMLRDEIKFNRPLMNGATGDLRIARNGNVERQLPLVLLRKASLARYYDSDLARLSEPAAK